MVFNERLRAALVRSGAKVKDVADRCGVRPMTVGRWLRGSTRPEAHNIAGLAELLGEDPVKLYREIYPEAP